MTWKNLLLAACVALAAFGCSVEQTEEGRMPDVDVDVDGGKLPEYDVDAADVDVDMEEKEVTLPDVDVDVDTEERKIKVPDVDVDMPNNPDD